MSDVNIIKEVKWPSFVIQGIILAPVTSFLLKGGGYANTWMFASLLLVLGLFSLQTTSVDFLYLYRIPNTNFKTHILRITTMISICCLYMGIYHANKDSKTLSAISGKLNGYFATLLIAGTFLIVIPILFNFIKNK